MYVLVEAFGDDAAGATHMQSAHFQKATAQLPAYFAQTPHVVNVTAPGSEWSRLGEMAVPERAWAHGRRPRPKTRHKDPAAPADHGYSGT